MTEAEQAAFDALAAKVKQLERAVKLLTRDFEKSKAPVELVAAEPVIWEFEQLPDGKTRATPILQ